MNILARAQSRLYDETAALTPTQSREQTQLLKKGTVWECIKFAIGVKGADIFALQRRVFKIGDAEDGRCFVYAIKGADIPALKTRLSELQM